MQAGGDVFLHLESKGKRQAVWWTETDEAKGQGRSGDHPAARGKWLYIPKEQKGNGDN